VNGVGYMVEIPLSTFYCLPEDGEEVVLEIHTHMGGDSIHLYGFASRREKELFQLLVGIPDIGPRMALNILSGLEVDSLVDAILKEDVFRLSSVPRVGRKMAERIILELKGKVTGLMEEPLSVVTRRPTVADDVLSALMNLGYRKAEAEQALKEVLKEEEGERVEDLLRASLRWLSQKRGR